ncbi:MAG: hypothetical protein KF860_13050 [Cyclobacteriaceae bacterium]|nr:hypothetical protein [Cyclobacteriaceae bacterium]
MGRNEIRLRRQRMTARGSERFRNYNSVLKRHEENKRIKKVARVFGFFVVILIVIMLIILLSRWEERARTKSSAYQKVNSISFTYPSLHLFASPLSSHWYTLP